VSTNDYVRLGANDHQRIKSRGLWCIAITNRCEKC
jgi:hypothetical protein